MVVSEEGCGEEVGDDTDGGGCSEDDGCNDGDDGDDDDDDDDVVFEAVVVVVVAVVVAVDAGSGLGVDIERWVRCCTGTDSDGGDLVATTESKADAGIVACFSITPATQSYD